MSESDLRVEDCFHFDILRKELRVCFSESEVVFLVPVVVPVGQSDDGAPKALRAAPLPARVVDRLIASELSLGDHGADQKERYEEYDYDEADEGHLDEHGVVDSVRKGHG
jgi:hypothetical protein